MKILVTGGTGFVGSNIVNALTAGSHNITVVDRSIKGGQLKSFRGKTLQADIADSNLWKNLATDFDAVIHQAAITDTTIQDEAEMMRVNCDAFGMLLDWAEKYNINVVYASSAATYGAAPAPQMVGDDEKPLNAYGRSKLAMDGLARERIGKSSIKIIGLRYFNVYGPGETHKGKMASMIHQLALQMKAGKHPRIFADGTQTRDQIYIADVIQANLLALHAPPSASGIYNVGTGRGTSFNRIVEVLNEVLETSLPGEYFENPYDFFQTHTRADISPTEEVLGFHPEFDIEKGIRAYQTSGML